MGENQYAYAVARIRYKETKLFDRKTFELLLACKNEAECIRILKEKGWGLEGDQAAEVILKAEYDKTWQLLEELVDDASVLNGFLYLNDFHNLKAAMKEVYTNSKVPNLYIDHGTVEAETIYQSVKAHDFSGLPEMFREIGKSAFQILLHAGDGQVCDSMIDREALMTFYEFAKKSNIEVLKGYAELKVVTANLNIAVRGSKTKKKKEFYEMALVPCATLDVSRLKLAALESEEAIYRYLENTAYSSAISAMQKSVSSFERWCDDAIMEQIRPQKYNSFTVSPLIAYLLAREMEIKSVRILLSGKRTGMNEEAIRERLRETYV